MKTIIILAGGDETRPAAPVPDADYVIAADSGLHLAGPLGLAVGLVIGDMDSVDPAVLAEAESGGAVVERHAVDKDSTDLELAMHAAEKLSPDQIVVVGGTGGRLDHLLADAALLATASVPMTWMAGPFVVTPVRHRLELAGTPGELVSIIPWDAEVTVSTTGLRWQLDNDLLTIGSTRSLSNEMVATAATVEVRNGVAIVLHRIVS